MKIAMFSDCYIPIINGVVTAIAQLKEGLEQRGHEVHVATVRYHGHKAKEQNVLRLPTLPFSLGKQSYGLGLDLFGMATRRMRSAGIELIHSHTEFLLDESARSAAKKLGIPIIHTFHTMWHDYVHYIPGGFLNYERIKRMYKTRLAPCAAIIAPSIKAKKYVLDIVPDMPVEVIPNGIDTSKFRSSQVTPDFIREARARYGLRDGEKLILFVGRIGPEKRVVPLLDAMIPVLRKHPNVKMAFVGDGNDLHNLRHRADHEKLHDRVLFPGFVTWKEIFAIYSIASLYCTASLSEVHPMTVIESLICGLPLVARRDDSYLDQIIEGENGHLVNSEEEMTRVVSDLIVDDGTLARYAKKSAAFASKFSAEGHTVAVEDFYKRVIKSYPARIAQK